MAIRVSERKLIRMVMTGDDRTHSKVDVGYEDDVEEAHKGICLPLITED